MDSALDILGYISALAVMIPLIFAFINFKHIRNYTWSLFIYFITSLLVEVISNMLLAFHMMINLSLVAFTYTILECILISLFYYRFFRQYTRARIIHLITILFVLVSMVCAYAFDLQKVDFYARAMECFIFTSYCLFLFYYVLKNLVFDNLLNSPIFWINTAILFYFAGNLIIFIFSEYITNHRSESYILLWKSIHTFFNVSMNILFGIGFWKLRTK
jgi:hypothetical protein